MWFQKCNSLPLTMYLSVSKLSSIFIFSLILAICPIILYLSLSSKIIFLEWTLFSSSIPISINIIIDKFGLIFSSTVLFISGNVLLFSDSYIKEDPFIKRFTFIVLLFVASINLLIFIPHIITLLIGWDGLGLISFLLVIYYQNPKSLAAGIITALTNRIGDALILISIAWALNNAHWNICFIWESSYSSIIIASVVVARITKRAQIPFSRWLPAAIAAPTPVSALVHSSTLVTGGVFLLFRFFPFISQYWFFSSTLLILAAITSFIAGLRAITECDIKKIIALSTLSQLGVIIVSLAIGAPEATFFHLTTHALFKALLFLCAGTLIHIFNHSQDLRFIGNIFNQIPSITSALLIANLALCGRPFLAGFYSKDLILEFSLFYPSNLIFLFLFFISTGLTARYTIRFLIIVLWRPALSFPQNPLNDNDLICSTSTWLLRIGAIVSGRALNWSLICPSTEFILPSQLKILTLAVSLLGLAFSWIIVSSYSSSKAWLISIPSINLTSCLMWYLVPLSSQKVIYPSFKIALIFSKSLDQGWEELIGGQGAFIISSQSRNRIQSIQNNTPTIFLSLAFISIPLLIFMS